MTASHQPRKIAVLLIGLAVLVVGLMAIGNLLHSRWLDGETEIAAAVARVDRLRSVASYRTVLDASPDQGQLLSHDYFLGEGTPAVLAANLLTQVKQLAIASGIEVGRTEGLPARPAGPITLIGGSLEMVGPSPAIYALLQQIEDNKPLLIVDFFRIRAMSPVADEKQSETPLTVELRLFGIIRSNSLPLSEQDG